MNYTAGEGEPHTSSLLATQTGLGAGSSPASSNGVEVPRYTLFLGFSRDKDATTEFAKIETASAWADLDKNSTEVGVGPTAAPTLGGSYWAHEETSTRKREAPKRYDAGDPPKKKTKAQQHKSNDKDDGRVIGLGAATNPEVTGQGSATKEVNNQKVVVRRTTKKRAKRIATPPPWYSAAKAKAKALLVAHQQTEL